MSKTHQTETRQAEKRPTANPSHWKMTAIKLALGLGVVIYVLRSKMINFEALGSVAFQSSNIITALVLLIVTSVLVTLRWHWLAQTQGLRLNYTSMLQLTMIGNFFNTFMPGSVGGDLIKAWYIAGREPKNKTKAILTVIVDRALGLTIFVFYAAVTLLLYSNTLENRPQLKILAYCVWGITLSAILFMSVFYFSRNRRVPGLPFLKQISARLPVLNKLLDAGRLYRDHLSTMLLAAVLSAVSFTAMIVMYKVEGNALGIEMGLGEYFFVIPLAVTVSAVPLLPGGIGVGQVAFFKLFEWSGYADPQQGATLCTLIQFYTILFNCLGAVFYVFFPRRTGSESFQEGEAPSEKPIETVTGKQRLG